MARVNLNQSASLKAARSKGTQEVRKVLDQALRGMKVLAPSGDHKHGSGRTVAGKKLKNSFTSSIVQLPLEVSGRITNTAEWASSMAEGSKPHRIVPKTKPFLVFRWDRGRASPRLSRHQNKKGLFFFRKVNHPGNRRRSGFMTTPLVQSGRKNNFITKTSRGI